MNVKVKSERCSEVLLYHFGRFYGQWDEKPEIREL